jgi:hypothetical protein
MGSKDDWLYFLRVVVAVIIASVLLIAVFPPKARADSTTVLTFKSEGSTVRLFDRPCLDKSVPVKDEMRRHLRYAEGDFAFGHGPNQLLVGCWRRFAKADYPSLEVDVIGTIWSDNDVLVFDAKLFEQEGL